MNYTQDSEIVEVFSKDLLKQEVDKNVLKDANEYIQELASYPSPDNCFEIAQILSFVIDDGFKARMNYLDLIADVKRTELGEKAQFKIKINGLKAFFQAKSATTERSKISTNYVSLDTEEISIRPVVDFLELKTGKVDMTGLAKDAVTQMEMATMKRIQDTAFNAFSQMGTPNYSPGAGIAKGIFDEILHSMSRIGGKASILGDIAAISKFTGITGYDGKVPDSLAAQHNQNGFIGTYLGANVIKLNNPFQANSLTETELRKDLIYVIPEAEKELMPIKVQFEGGVQTTHAPVNISSKKVEFRFDQYVGAGIVGIRKLLGVYQDTTLKA